MVISFIKKYKWEILFILGFSVLYFFLRLTHIMSLPIFTDEAIYTRWTQIAKQDANWRFISLTDGKQPLFIWIAIASMKFIKDPLLAVRLVSVFSGFFTAIGLFFLTRELFKNKWIAYISAAIYVLFPFGLVYDRMALYDSLVASSIIWGIYIEVLLAKRVRLDIALIAGMAVGLGMLNKTTANLNLYLLPFTLFVFDWKQKHLKKQLLKWILYAGIVAALANVYYGILRLSPYFGIINEKNHTFYYPFTEWLQHPFNFFHGNINGMLNWFIIYVGWIPIIVGIIGLITQWKFWKEKMVLLVWSIPPFIAFAFIAKILYPRYILPMVVPLIPIIALGLWYLLTKWKHIWVKVVIILVFAATYIRADYYIINDFAHAYLPKPDRDQYINGWPSGGGVKEATAFFAKQAQQGPIYIATEGTFGLMPYAFEIYLVSNPQITIHGLWPIEDQINPELLTAAKKMPTYVVFYQPCIHCQMPGDAPTTWPLKQIAQYDKGIEGKYMRVYQVIPQK